METIGSGSESVSGEQVAASVPSPSIDHARPAGEAQRLEGVDSWLAAVARTAAAGTDTRSSWGALVIANRLEPLAEPDLCLAPWRRSRSIRQTKDPID